MRRRRYVHMYVPTRLLPLWVFVIGRQQCCGVHRRSVHLDSCPRHPWESRPAVGRRSLDAATPLNHRVHIPGRRVGNTLETDRCPALTPRTDD